MNLVHRVLHLDNPTVTLCIRTVNDTELSQWHHLSSGISYQQKNIDELTIKRILYFQFLYESNPMTAKDYLDHMLGLISVASQLALYESLFQDEFGLEPEITYFMIDHMRMRFQDLKWFDQYETHYKKMNQQLFEVQASRGELKLLAHGINQNYSLNEINDLLKVITKESTSILCQKLLEDDPIFNDEHYEKQQQTIRDFSKSIPKTKPVRKVIHEH
jgi:AraC-like DNA-binding protein